MSASYTITLRGVSKDKKIYLLERKFFHLNEINTIALTRSHERVFFLKYTLLGKYLRLLRYFFSRCSRARKVLSHESSINSGSHQRNDLPFCTCDDRFAYCLSRSFSRLIHFSRLFPSVDERRHRSRRRCSRRMIQYRHALARGTKLGSRYYKYVLSCVGVLYFNALSPFTSAANTARSLDSRARFLRVCLADCGRPEMYLRFTRCTLDATNRVRFPSKSRAWQPALYAFEIKII